MDGRGEGLRDHQERTIKGLKTIEVESGKPGLSESEAAAAGLLTLLRERRTVNNERRDVRDSIRPGQVRNLIGVPQIEHRNGPGQAIRGDWHTVAAGE